MPESLKKSIEKQRHILAEMIAPGLLKIATSCSNSWPDKERLNLALEEHLSDLPYCSFLYVLGTDGIQVSDNINKHGRFPEHFGRDRSARPYLNSVYPAVELWLSEAYISLLQARPSITAIQLIRKDGKVIGLLGADFDLRSLPLTRVLYEEPKRWHQIKGDPAIRGFLFQQTRTNSMLDSHIDEVIAIILELITYHGVFHGKLLFSSSRASLWQMDDPYRYRILDIEALIDPDICFAYPIRDYPKDAVIPIGKIHDILTGFKRLRFSDETIYLRAGSINIFNGMVGLNFSCDGSHYLPWDAFLMPDNSFWNGDIVSTNRPAIEE